MGQKQIQNDKKRSRVVFIGGGIGGAFGIRELYKKGINDLMDVYLINDHDKSCYSGMITGAICGYYKKEECFIDLKEMCKLLEYNFIQKRVEKICPKEQNIYMSDGTIIPYDILVMNIGASGSGLKDIQGVERYTVSSRPLYYFFERLEAKELELGISNKKNNDKLIKIGIVGGGFCGFEIAFCTNYRWRTLFNQNCEITMFLKEEKIESNVMKNLTELLEKREIKYETGRKVIAVQENGIVFDNNELRELDIIVWAGGPCPNELNKNSGLVLSDKGWIVVNEYLQASFDNVFGVGDCIDLNGHALKAGVYAVNESKIVAKNICTLVKNIHFDKKEELEKFSQQKDVLQLLSMGNKQSFRHKNGFVLHGSYYYYLKKMLDHNFIHRFKQNPKNDWTYRLKI